MWGCWQMQEMTLLFQSTKNTSFNRSTLVMAAGILHLLMGPLLFSLITRSKWSSSIFLKSRRWTWLVCLCRSSAVGWPGLWCHLPMWGLLSLPAYVELGQELWHRRGHKWTYPDQIKDFRMRSASHSSDRQKCFAWFLPWRDKRFSLWNRWGHTTNTRQSRSSFCCLTHIFLSVIPLRHPRNQPGSRQTCVSAVRPAQLWEIWRLQWPAGQPEVARWSRQWDSSRLWASGHTRFCLQRYSDRQLQKSRNEKT